jgi:hypothetical protein
VHAPVGYGQRNARFPNPSHPNNVKTVKQRLTRPHVALNEPQQKVAIASHQSRLPLPQPRANSRKIGVKRTKNSPYADERAKFNLFRASSAQS